MRHLTRRQFLKTTAAGATALSLPTFWRTTDAKTNLHLALWSHWVPGANDTCIELIQNWGKKNNIEIKVDFLGSQDAKTKAAAASRAGVGPDILHMDGFDSGLYADKLVACNDMVDRLTKQHGALTEVTEYTLKHDGKWIGAPVCLGNQSAPLATRISIFKKYCGIDITELFPIDSSKRDVENIRKVWTYDNLLAMGKTLVDAGAPPLGFGLSEATDSGTWLQSLFMAFGSTAVNEKGDIEIESDATLAALEYVTKLSACMPDQVYGWDNASNNRFLISGSGSAIYNPPSAWAVAVKDNPEVGKDIWHHDNVYGPKGAFRGAQPTAWCLWEYSKNKEAALDIMEYMSGKEPTFALIQASKGFDLATYKAYADAPIYAEVAPPKGTIYNYVPRGEETVVITGYPAPRNIATQIYTKNLYPVMCAKVTTKEMKPKEAIAWAIGQLQDYGAGA